MEENKKSGHDGILWFLVLVSLGLSAYTLFSLSKPEGFSSAPASGAVVPAVASGQSNSYVDAARKTLLEAAKSVVSLQGTVVSKTADGLEMDAEVLDVAKIEAISGPAIPSNDQLTKKIRIMVLVDEDTYFPFKTLEQFSVGEKVIVAAGQSILEGKPVVATHLYNHIPGL